MAGSHEVRGSNPLFSTMNSIAGRTIGQRFFYLQARGLEPRFFVRGGFYSTASPRLGAFLLGYLGFRARISRLTCTLGRGTSFFMPRSRSGGSGSCLRCTLRRTTRFFATVFLFARFCCVAILLSRSSQSCALRDVTLDCFPVGFPVARGRGVSAGNDPDGHGLVHV